MFQLVVGPAKAGKTAYMVYQAKLIKQKYPDTYVISNVPGHACDMNISDWSVLQVLTELAYNDDDIKTGIHVPFGAPKEKPKVLILDECQRYFTRSFYRMIPDFHFRLLNTTMSKIVDSLAFERGIPENVYFFFEYHAHYRYTIYAATHGKDTVVKRLVEPAENVVVMQRSSKRLLGNITYFLTDWGRVEETSEKKSFSLSNVKGEYISSEQGEGVKPTFALKKLAILGVMVIGGLLTIGNEDITFNTNQKMQQRYGIEQRTEENLKKKYPGQITSPGSIKKKYPGQITSTDYSRCIEYIDFYLCRSDTKQFVGQGIMKNGVMYQIHKKQAAQARNEPESE
jgi:hypothetical protein